MTEFTHLTCDFEDRIARVVLTRPPVNAISQVMYREIATLFKSTELSAEADAVVLTGAGRNFCAGNDLEEFATLTPENSGERMAEVRAAFFAIQDCPIPVIGAVNGAALGTGLAIAASCDFVIAADDARLGTPEISVGVMGGAKHLARLVPEPWVRWMYFSGQPVGAPQLAALGAIIEVCTAQELMEHALEHADRITRNSGAAIRMAKRSLNAIETMDLQPGYIFEQSLTGELSGHPDSQEAVRATLERRAPQYPSRQPA